MSCNSDRSKYSKVIYTEIDHVEMSDSPVYESANEIYDTAEMGNDNSEDMYG